MKTSQLYNLSPHIACRYMCPDCHGDGSIGGGECIYCNGSGECYVYIPLLQLRELLNA